ncbi:tetratricopeptide repeat protein [Nocardiopsis ansamitocini]|nr:hypothetical protein [Nocardiopsis ansamitocini]
MSGTPLDSDAGDSDFASLCDQARDLAEAGHLRRAAAIYERVAAEAGPSRRAQASLGLAVVHEQLGDPAAARRADENAVATGHPEFGPRAAYHLALLHERAGAAAEEAAAWRQVLAFDNERYLQAAHRGLARLAEERGDEQGADQHWQLALEGQDAAVVAATAHDYARGLLARGAVTRAEEVIARGLAAQEDPALRVLLGAVHVERAIAEFGAATAGGPGGLDPMDTGVAYELLARLLAVRGDADTSATAWEEGLDHRDPSVAAEVRTRLRRGFLVPDAEDADTEPAPSWWDPYLEAAVAQDSVPMLAGELFLALDQLYSHLALPHASGEARAAALRAVVEQAVRAPGEYVWGRALHDDFRERLRRATGGDVLPPGWPD